MTRKFYLLIIFGVIISNKLISQSPTNVTTLQDSMYTSIFYNHLYSNFDDIHDVSMRFHHIDYKLNGLIVLQIHWKDGIVVKSSVLKNETKNDNFAYKLLDNINNWQINDIKGYFYIDVPLQIKIVGSDDPSFQKKGIFTGRIINKDHEPIKNAKISIFSSENGNDSLRTTLSNREGIFVKTLIPLGNWNAKIYADKYEARIIRNISFDEASQHLRKDIILWK